MTGTTHLQYGFTELILQGMGYNMWHQFAQFFRENKLATFNVWDDEADGFHIYVRPEDVERANWLLDATLRQE